MTSAIARASILLVAIPALSGPAAVMAQSSERPRVREFGLTIGSLSPGPLNAITDVPGVMVGHSTVIEGDSIRTGVTAIRPHAGNVFLDKVPAAIHVANGFGKLIGVTQVVELGTIETPILLTNTLAIGRAADALVRWTLSQTDDPDVRSVNPVVGETNDGYLNAIRVPRVGAAEVEAALAAAGTGRVAEGAVGAGTGTRALGFKGGIGTASRSVVVGSGRYILGVLVQSNFGGELEIQGVPVGRTLGREAFHAEGAPQELGGSIMIIVATDAPVDAGSLERIARRAPYAIGRVGGYSAHGSGDYVIAFSTAAGTRVPHYSEEPVLVREVLRGEALDPLFVGVVEATEEAILNSLFRATTVVGHRGTAEALPLDGVRRLLTDAHRIDPR